MTGPEHYRQAEWLSAPKPAESGQGSTEPRPEYVARAQVHATLALAAATALATIAEMPQADFDAWLRVTATEVPS